MTDHLPFGAHVLVAYRVEPRYLRWRTVTVREPLTPGSVFESTREVLDDPPVLVTDSYSYLDGDHVGDIGDPCPGSKDVPEKGVHRRLRRFPEDLTGLVVGWVWRSEGQYHAATGGGYSLDGHYDEEPAFLAESGRIRLYQVAVDPGEVGQRFFPARIVLAHPDDVREVNA